jgi:protein-L-isoaspartate O-methyltransferase
MASRSMPSPPRPWSAMDTPLAGTARVYPITQGVLSLLDTQALHLESAREMKARDERNAAILSGDRQEWSSEFSDAIEGARTLDALDVDAGMTVCELGCGAGRYTAALSARARAVVAIDLSMSGLLATRNKLEPAALVGLVQADVTQPYAASGTFDRVLSTLHSNLPSREHRSASLGQINATLREGGKAVVSMHHYALRDVLLGVPRSGRYPDSGIYRYHLTTGEARREIDLYFERVRFEHVGASLPGIRSIRLTQVAARIPLVRSALSRLILAVIERPRPVHGQNAVRPRPVQAQ